MIVLIQWTTNPPQDWQSIDLGPSGRAARAWRDLPNKPEPVGGEVIDATPGWIFDVCIDGLLLGGYDHYAAEPLSNGGVRFFMWNDDPDDWTPDQYHADVWDIHPHRNDPKVGGKLNTNQVLTRYHGSNPPTGWLDPVQTTGGPVTYRPWSQFVPPPAANQRHGIWTPEPLNSQHYEVRRRPSWREW